MEQKRRGKTIEGDDNSLGKKILICIEYVKFDKGS